MGTLYTTLVVIGTVFGLVITTLVAFLLNTIIHESGHAIAIVLLTRKKVSVYLGTYGDEQKSRCLKLGYFEIWIVKNLFKWKGGLCRPLDKNNSIAIQYLITVAGPIATLIFSLCGFYFLFYFNPEGWLLPFLAIFSVVTALSFISNIIPRNEAIMSANGELIYNDGYRLKQLKAQSKLPPEFNIGSALMAENKYNEAKEVFERIIINGTRNPDVYRMAIAANIETKNYLKAEELHKERMAKIGNLNSHDQMILAILKTHLGKYDEAIAYFKHLLQISPKNKYNLNNLGYTLILINRYEEAIPYLDRAILVDSLFAPAYTNRAFARLQTGLLEEGKIDNDYTLSVNANSSYSYRNSGLYEMKKGNYQAALHHFNKALELDPKTHLVDKYIDELKDVNKEHL